MPWLGPVCSYAQTTGQDSLNTHEQARWDGAPAGRHVCWQLAASAARRWDATFLLCRKGALKLTACRQLDGLGLDASSHRYHCVLPLRLHTLPLQNSNCRRFPP